MNSKKIKKLLGLTMGTALMIGSLPISSSAMESRNSELDSISNRLYI